MVHLLPVSHPIHYMVYWICDAGGNVVERYWWTTCECKSPSSLVTISHWLMELRNYRQFWHIAHSCTSLCWNRHIKANPPIVSPKLRKSRWMEQPNECAHSVAVIEDRNKKMPTSSLKKKQETTEFYQTRTESLESIPNFIFFVLYFIKLDMHHTL